MEEPGGLYRVEFLATLLLIAMIVTEALIACGVGQFSVDKFVLYCIEQRQLCSGASGMLIEKKMQRKNTTDLSVSRKKKETTYRPPLAVVVANCHMIQCSHGVLNYQLHHRGASGKS
ncbi:hypothetical protein T01_15924 [Trichinella spiralis]|uniref:Uncharacterized protein n=2 Tax=Trichinella spiralis TaxID=6334 RepID=A0A0V1AR13_TRISP|nr:hypothetical protein T01_15924 [Trichinella spiralis]